MLVGRTGAFRSKECPFWVKFGYVVPEIKYTPKLVELIRYNVYGLCFMKSAVVLAAKIPDIDRQQACYLRGQGIAQLERSSIQVLIK